MANTNASVEAGPPNPARKGDQKKIIILETVHSRNAASAALLRDCNTFVKEMAGDRFLKVVEDAKSATGKKVQKALRIQPGSLGGGMQSERALIKAYGWYWEPLFHDLAFFEEMRDSVSLLAGTYNAITQLAMQGLSITHSDPDIQKEFTNFMLNDYDVNFREVVRSTIYQLATIANAYFIPIKIKDDKDGSPKLYFRPIRATAIRKLRDDDLRIMGYVQLLHRPSEFINGAIPSTPTVYDRSEVLNGTINTDGWYAYGKPGLASLSFVLKLKLQMEKDVAELLHQHVPRMNITYTPEPQSTQDQVDLAIADLKTKVAGLDPNDSFVHTPDVKMEYAGPAGHSMDIAPPQKHIEDQFWSVMSMGPGQMGRDTTVNPIMAQQQWQVTQAFIEYLREAVKVMYRPALTMFAELRDLDMQDEEAVLDFKDHNDEGNEQNARTQELLANNANTMRQAGFISQDDGAQLATSKHFPGGPRKKAAEEGPISPPVDPNVVGPDGKKLATPGQTGKVGDKKKGPGGKKGGTPDKRPKGKRHEALDFTEAIEGIECATETLRNIQGRVDGEIGEGGE